MVLFKDRHLSAIRNLGRFVINIKTFYFDLEECNQPLHIVVVGCNTPFLFLIVENLIEIWSGHFLNLWQTESQLVLS